MSTPAQIPEAISILFCSQGTFDVGRDPKLARLFQGQRALRTWFHPAGLFQRLFGAGMPIVRVDREQFGLRLHGAYSRLQTQAILDPSGNDRLPGCRHRRCWKSPPGGGTGRAFSLGSFGGKNFRSGNSHGSRMFPACVEIALFRQLPDGRRRIDFVTLTIAVPSGHSPVTVRLLHPRQNCRPS